MSLMIHKLYTLTLEAMNRIPEKHPAASLFTALNPSLYSDVHLRLSFVNASHLNTFQKPYKRTYEQDS